MDYGKNGSYERSVRTMKNNFNKKRTIKKFSASSVLVGIMFVMLFLYCVSLLIPVLWMIWSSFKDDYSFTVFPFEFPDVWYPSNYPEVLQMLRVKGIRNGAYYSYGVVEMTGYSLLIAGLMPISSIFWPMVSGYILSKYNFRGKKFLIGLNLFIMTVPFVGTLPAGLRIHKAIGSYDNLLLRVVLSATPFGFNFILFYGAFKAISNSYMEAAFIDGASHFKVMIRIMLPMMIPMFAARYILLFVQEWNDYMTVITWLPSYPNLAFGMYMFQNEAARNNVAMPHILAGFVIVAIPTSILWIFSQRLITSKLMVGGLKE